MKPRSIGITTQGSLGGTRVAMEFDSHSIAHIMSVLTDLYSDPELAIVREYATNAYDSHIAAGCSKPIEISTANAISPFFVVQDFGLGLSVDELIEIYSKYGASTKRDSDEQTGMLGLGSKSALTYADQFTVIAIKNGIKTTVLISRDESGQGIMEIVDTVSCNEGNGVTIRIPTKSGNLAKKAQDFFGYWPSGTVLLNGRLNEFNVPANAIAIDSDTWLFPNTDWDDSYDIIIMGNIPYRLHRNNYDDFYIVHRADIGAVDFTPNREQLHLTKRTNEYIADLRGYVKRRYESVVLQQVAQQPDKPSALRFAYSNVRLVPSRQRPMHAGVMIPDRIEFSWEYMLGNRSGSLRYATRYLIWSNTRKFFLENNAALVCNAPAAITSYQRQRIRKFMEAHGLGGYTVFATADKNDWLAYDFDWQQIADWRMPRQQHAKAYGRKPHKIFNSYYFSDIFADNIDSTVPCYIVDNTDVTNAELAAKILGGPVIYVSPNRVQKFKRDFPLAHDAMQAMRAAASSELAALSDEQYYLLVNKEYGKSVLQGFDPAKVNDPDLRWAITIMSQPIDNALRSRVSLFMKVGYKKRDTSSIAQRIAAAMQRYPLLAPLFQSSGLRYRNEMYDYINAIYGNGVSHEV